jgi:Fe(3+) dicitrate transport protein
MGNWHLGGLVEFCGRETAGFKTLLDTRGNDSGKSTGFERSDLNTKLKLEHRGERIQSLELRYGFTDLLANETYLGLSESDFRQNPHQRYAASGLDEMDTLQERYSLRYTLRNPGQWSLTATAYRNDFERLWYKLNDVRVAASSTWRNPSEVLAGAHGALGVLKGSEAGDLRVRANNRAYASKGLELSGSLELDGEWQHRIEGGIRYHEDFEDRFQWDDQYAISPESGMLLTKAGIPGTQDNRRGSAAAWALYLQDRIQKGSWSVTPGIRHERIEYTDTRRNTTPGDGFNQLRSRSEESLHVFAPGLGITWQAKPGLEAFAGIYRGFSLPGPSQATGALKLREERSTGTELGLRWQNQGGDWQGEWTLFSTTFEDLIVENNVGGGGISGNAGQAYSRGVEALLRWQPSRSRWQLVRPSAYASFTYTRARLDNDSNASGAGGDIVESIFAGGFKGASLPYIPGYQVNLGLSLDAGRWSWSLSGYHQPATYATASNTHLSQRPDGTPDARFGRIPAQWNLDCSLSFRLRENLKLQGNVSNLLDRDGMVSRVPHGPRPSAPRQYSIGMQWLF